MQALGQQLSWLRLSRFLTWRQQMLKLSACWKGEREMQWALALSFKKSREKLSVYWQSKKACWGRFAWGLGNPGFSLCLTSDFLHEFEQILGTAALEFLEVPLLPSWESTDTPRTERTCAGGPWQLTYWRWPLCTTSQREEKTADVEKKQQETVSWVHVCGSPWALPKPGYSELLLTPK